MSIRRQHALAYLAAVLAGGVSPTLGLVMLSIPTWHGMASLRGLVSAAFVFFAFAFAYLVPVAVLLRRLLLFRAVAMGVAGFVPAAALMAWVTIGAVQSLPDGSVVPVSWANLLQAVGFYGLLGAGSGWMFHFVFRAIAGKELMPGGSIEV